MARDFEYKGHSNLYKPASYDYKGEILVKLEFPTRYDLAQTGMRVKKAEDLIRGAPELRHTLATIGKA